MNELEHPAIVIGGLANGLGIIRNLGRNGVNVYCAAEDSRDFAVFSKYCSAYFVLPRIEHDEGALGAFLRNFENKLGCRPILFPTTDISSLNVAHLAGENYSFTAPHPDREVLETLVNKRKFYNSLMKKGVPHPITLFPDIDNSEFFSKSNGEKISFPVFVKPSISQVFRERFRKKGFIAKSERELYRYIQLAARYGIDVVIQEIVPGPPRNHYFISGYLDRNSRPIALFAQRRLRMWPQMLGDGTVAVSVPISEVTDLKETILEYLASTGFHGLFNAEFKRDPRDNVGKLVEVNPRSWIDNSFPSACGANIILTAYLDLIGRGVERIEDYEVGTYLLLSFSDDLRSSSLMFVRGELSFREWVSPMTGKVHSILLARDDSKPFIMNFLYGAIALFRAARRSPY